jgi:hypothetical protein
MKMSSRLPMVLGPLLVVPFCGFGFRASFEIAKPVKRLPWQLGYGAIGIASILASLGLARRRNREEGGSPEI